MPRPRWISDHGTVEIGYDYMTDSFIRALENEVGIVWQKGPAYQSIDAALAQADAGVARWMKEQGMDGWVSFELRPTTV